MQLRHVRAIAVFGIAVVALTGARGSHGGGCHSDSGGSGSSSSSGGGSTGSTGGGAYKDDNDSTTTGGSSGSGSTTGSTTGGGKATDPAKDVKIETCVFDDARGIVAHVSATNSSASTTYTYKFSVTFKGPDGSVVRTSNSTIPYVSANSTDTLDVAASYVPAAGQSASGSTCKLSAVTRTAE
ncbi:hypothetical protein AQJ43_05115 [Streptomyces avermitilis]|uniref:Uncharacterized protein n=1 Tax=Streptomyces avermitilis TaxID=33903 RepID=A0A4D4LZU4_STRAX|nr:MULTISPECIES: hypothetical protein [Streptomyces]KUN56945.1 hypothetical protein AQJ43_05115 [Streptomyces avermitilis]MYS99409.1 hypothetical protein [Streptomyces sp. SID5469]OOV32327.1 hypothetical protein SM007_05615 [Streptomyces avermitilis]BBJ51750.1 hypothetical protein SAVMC3_43790 [Streptomyces avermitilis]GDY63789.1 hypothetical protein SAV14893_031820 [Streptomyces avermitilis]